MATKSITPSSEILQEISDPSPQSTVINQGHEYLVSGVLAYLEDASFTGLGSFELRQTAEASGIRREIGDLLGRWLVALALRRYTQWQMSRPLQPRKINGNGAHSPAEPVPPDVTDLDPFLRTAAESGAIRREQPAWKTGRWPEYFRLYGCLICQSKENPGAAAAGLCARCYERTRQRLKRIEADLRREAALGRY